MNQAQNELADIVSKLPNVAQYGTELAQAGIKMARFSAKKGAQVQAVYMQVAIAEQQFAIAFLATAKALEAIAQANVNSGSQFALLGPNAGNTGSQATDNLYGPASALNETMKKLQQVGGLMTYLNTLS